MGVKRPTPLPPHVVAAAAQHEHLISTDRLAELGLPRQRVLDRVRQGSLVRVATGVYDCEVTPPQARTIAWARAQRWPEPGTVVDHLRRRAVHAALLERGPAAVAVGLASLTLHGVRGIPQTFDPGVCWPTRAPRTPSSGSRVRRLRHLEVTTTTGGVRLSPLPDALAQGVLELTRRPGGRAYAVAILDDVRSRGLLDDVGARRACTLLRNRPGAVLAREWWALSDPGSQSPAETWARLSCLDLGIPPDRLQLEVRTADGVLIARVDLAWLLPDGRYLLVEIDGEDVHSTPAAVVRDRSRQNDLAAVGPILRFTGADAWHGRVASTVRSHLEATGWLPRRASADRGTLGVRLSA